MHCLTDTTLLRSIGKPNTETIDDNQDESILGLIHNSCVMTNFSQMDVENRLDIERAQEQEQNRC